MKIEGRVTPPRCTKNKHWSVEISLLDIHTQGSSKADAYLMAADAIEALVDKKGFKVICTPSKGNGFVLTANDRATFMSFVLGRLRTTRNLSVREMAERLHASSPNTYARYEQGRAMPKFDTLEALLQAIDPRLGLVLSLG